MARLSVSGPVSPAQVRDLRHAGIAFAQRQIGWKSTLWDIARLAVYAFGSIGVLRHFAESANAWWLGIGGVVAGMVIAGLLERWFIGRRAAPPLPKVETMLTFTLGDDGFLYQQPGMATRIDWNLLREVVADPAWLLLNFVDPDGGLNTLYGIPTRMFAAPEEREAWIAALGERLPTGKAVEHRL